MHFLKRIKPAVSILLIFAVFIPIFFICVPHAAALQNPTVAAKAAYLYENSSGTTLLNIAADERLHPASTTKIMTALLAIEAITDGTFSENDIVTCADDIWFDISSDGSTQNIMAGEQMKLVDLIRCALIASANESCNAIASYVSGDISTFVNLMNTKAKALGCNGTHFENTHGMPDENHYTTAHDICTIFAAAYKYKLFRNIIGTVACTIPATNSHVERSLKNTNVLLSEKSSSYYEYCTGGKTGSTDAAGYCLVSAAEKDGLTVFAAVMGTELVKQEDGSKQAQSFSETKKLFEWAFGNFSYQTMLAAGELIKEIPVAMGDGADSVVLCPASSISALLPNDADLTKCRYDISVFEDSPGEGFTAPIKRGDALGKLTLSYNGKNYGTVSLVANRSIELQKIEYVKTEIHNILANKYVKLFIAFVIFMFVAYLAFVIVYNVKRSRRKKAAKAAAAKRMEEMRRNEAPTTGRDFEEIEKKYERREQFKDFFDSEL